MTYAIKVENLSKRYLIRLGNPAGSLQELVILKKFWLVVSHLLLARIHLRFSPDHFRREKKYCLVYPFMTEQLDLGIGSLCRTV